MLQGRHRAVAGHLARGVDLTGFPPRLGQQEARITQAVFAAGVPAPEVLGEVTLDGRFGIVLGRLDGPTLLQVTRSGAATFAQAGAILASLGLSVHSMSPPPEAFHLHGWIDTASHTPQQGSGWSMEFLGAMATLHKWQNKPSAIATSLQATCAVWPRHRDHLAAALKTEGPLERGS